MQRKKKSETVERLRRIDNDDFAMLRRQALRWCEDNLKTLSTADPAVPETLNDRAADNWRPLLAVADRAGSEWPKRARDAALVLSGGFRGWRINPHATTRGYQASAERRDHEGSNQ
jgi:hypothetical protein